MLSFLSGRSLRGCEKFKSSSILEIILAAFRLKLQGLYTRVDITPIILSRKSAQKNPKIDRTLIFSQPLTHFPHLYLLLCVILWFFLMGIDEAHADLPPYTNQQMIQAARYYEAKTFPKALEIYQGLLELPLDPTEQAIITYNIGNVFLDQHDWDKAIGQYQKILQNKLLSPLLKRPIQTNLAIAKFHKAQQISAQLDKSPNSLDTYNQAVFLYREALHDVQNASESDCELGKQEGRSTCIEELDLSEIREAIKLELAQLLKNGKEELIKQASLKEGIPFLYSAIDAFSTNLDFLGSVPDQLKKPYQEYIVSEADSWIPLWMSLKEKYPHPDLQNKEEGKQFTIFEESRKFYQLAIRDLEKNKKEMSKQALQQSKDKLKDVTHLIWEKNSLEELFYKLLSAYDVALSHESLQEPELAGLKVEQDQFFQISIQKLPQTDSEIKKWSQEMQEDLTASMDAAAKGDMREARFYLIQGRQSVKMLLWHVNKKESATDTLQKAIDEQEYALSLNRLWLENGEMPKLPLKDLLKQSEEETITQASPFLEKVKQEQIKEFQSPLHPNQLDLRCQCTPWDEVLPLFNDGFQKAQDVRQLMENPTQEARHALSIQEEIVKKWKEALKKMQQPKKPRKQRAPEKQKGEKEANQPQPIPLNENLRLLQEMENADILPLPQPQTTQKVLRPW